jgi:hypothetical protein
VGFRRVAVIDPLDSRFSFSFRLHQPQELSLEVAIRTFGPFQIHQAFSRACSHYSQRFDDECKAEKRQENDVQFFKT